MRLPVGARVVMSNLGKVRWENSDNNPHDIAGTVEDFVEEDYEEGLADFQQGILEKVYFPFNVEWDNNTNNDYCYGDLTPIGLPDKPLEDYL